MKNLAPDIFRQRILIGGEYSINVNEKSIEKYFKTITIALNLRVYGKPIIHSPSGIGKEINRGYDAFIPLIDSGIYIGVRANAKFPSLILYTCKRFEERKAIKVTKEFFKMKKIIPNSF